MSSSVKILGNMIIQDLRKTLNKNFEGLHIRPSKKNTRLFIDNEYFEKGYARLLPKSVLAVYCVLAKYANHETQTCFPSIETMMRESGIKNRNTVIKALKILEAYRIIYIEHSKGGLPNQYALLNSDAWKEPNSINTDTVNSITSDTETVSKNELKQYQNSSSNSITSDTGNHLIKSSNEIRDKIKNISNKEIDMGIQISKGAFSVLKCYWKENDITEAISLLREDSKEISFRTVKDLLKQWSGKGKITSIKDMKW